MQQFIVTFIKSRGSIREMEKQYGISYPTVRARLDEIIAALDGREIAGDREPADDGGGSGPYTSGTREADAGVYSPGTREVNAAVRKATETAEKIGVRMNAAVQDAFGAIGEIGNRVGAAVHEATKIVGNAVTNETAEALEEAVEAAVEAVESAAEMVDEASAEAAAKAAEAAVEAAGAAAEAIEMAYGEAEAAAEAAEATVEEVEAETNSDGEAVTKKTQAGAGDPSSRLEILKMLADGDIEIETARKMLKAVHEED